VISRFRSHGSVQIVKADRLSGRWIGSAVSPCPEENHLNAKTADQKSYRAYAWAATFAVVVIPAICVLSLLFFVEPDPPVIAVSVVSLLLSSGASFLGSHLWMRRADSVDLSFSDLMLWSFWRRQRAEIRLARGAELLGLDSSGRPANDQPSITREERLKILHELSAALESKDPYTHGHSQRVERHSFRIGAALGLSVTDLEDLRLAAALHDVGKIRVSDKILRKPGKLTDEEFKEMQDHSVVGAWMVSSVGNPDVISAVRHHHERFNGGGYPDGIGGHEIPLFARIICVADAFDAITSSRPYRAKSERDRAIKIIREESGKQFDPLVVNAFLSSLPAPAPVTAALAFLLPGPARVVRKTASLVREMGGAGIAETVRAASVTVVLSASVAAPVAQYVAPDRAAIVEKESGGDGNLVSAPASGVPGQEVVVSPDDADVSDQSGSLKKDGPSALVDGGGEDPALAGEVVDPLDPDALPEDDVLGDETGSTDSTAGDPDASTTDGGSSGPGKSGSSNAGGNGNGNGNSESSHAGGNGKDNAGGNGGGKGKGGTDNPGGGNSGTDNPGTDNPGHGNGGTDNPGNGGTENPGGGNSGTDNPGTDNPGSGNGNGGSGNSGTDNPGSGNGNGGSGNPGNGAGTTNPGNSGNGGDPGGSRR
jgi:HD superfamily phosphohydrolase YqeK